MGRRKHKHRHSKFEKIYFRLSMNFKIIISENIKDDYCSNSYIEERRNIGWLLVMGMYDTVNNIDPDNLHVERMLF